MYSSTVQLRAASVKFRVIGVDATRVHGDHVVLRIPEQRFHNWMPARLQVARPLLVTLAQRIRERSRRAADD